MLIRKFLWAGRSLDEKKTFIRPPLKPSNFCLRKDWNIEYFLFPYCPGEFEGAEAPSIKI